MRNAVARVMVEPSFRRSAARVRDEIGRYAAHAIVDDHLAALVESDRA